MLITCCLLAADGVLQISGKRKLTSGKMEDKENGKTPAQLKDELAGVHYYTSARHRIVPLRGRYRRGGDVLCTNRLRIRISFVVMYYAIGSG